MAAGYQNITLEQGATFDLSITIDDVNGQGYDLTQASARSQVRKSYYSANAVIEFTATVNPNTSTITLSLDSSQTANVKAGRYVYDTILDIAGAPEQANTVIRILEGIVDVSPRVTR